MNKLILILIAATLDGIFTLLAHSLGIYVIWNFLLVDITGITIGIGDAVGALAIIYSIINYVVICNGKATGTLKYLEKTKV
jgi:hypothetical protein